MNLNQLRFANEVALSGSFTAAAVKCCVTQPTLSNGIAQLETDLGERLFVRTTRKVSLTPFGAHIIPYVAQVLDAQASMQHQAQLFLSPKKQLIRIGTSPLVSPHLLGLMMEPFRQQNPGVDLVLREMNMADLYRMLEEGLIDFAFGVAGMRRGALLTIPLYADPLVFIPRGAVWRGDSRMHSVQMKDIADEVYVMVPDACGLSSTTRALFRSHRRKLHEYSGEAMSYQVLEEWAALGVGAAILPQSKLSPGVKQAYVIVDKAGQEVVIEFEAICQNAANRPHFLSVFADHLRHVAPGIVGGLKSLHSR
jgi:LysR family transcriptional regulator, hydrogen peroxide-inducible genes activator